jgi:hypothetical protein
MRFSAVTDSEAGSRLILPVPSITGGPFHRFRLILSAFLALVRSEGIACVIQPNHGVSAYPMRTHELTPICMVRKESVIHQ